MEGGRALADVLLGKVDPSGRLPFAVPTDAGHSAAFDRDARTATYDLFHGQWLLDRDGHEARYPFGFGLSYGTPAKVLDASVTAGDGAVIVTAQVTNDGHDTVTEVVQAFAGLPGSRFERPPWRLAAYERVDVPAGASRRVELTVPLRRLAVRAGGAWLIEAGAYEFAVGRHARDPGAATARVELPERTID
jgi:beta-glucosidase